MSGSYNSLNTQYNLLLSLFKSYFPYPPSPTPYPPPADVMTLSTIQTASGLKTFSVLPRSSVVPIDNADLVNKLYVDTHGGGGSVGTIDQVLAQGNTAIGKTQYFTALGDTHETHIDNTQVHILDTNTGDEMFIDHNSLILVQPTTTHQTELLGTMLDFQTPENLVSCGHMTYQSGLAGFEAYDLATGTNSLLGVGSLTIADTNTGFGTTITNGQGITTAVSDGTYNNSMNATYAQLGQSRQLIASPFTTESATISGGDGLYSEYNDVGGTGNDTKLSMKASSTAGTIRCYNSGTSALGDIDFQASALTLNGNPFPAIPNIDQVLNAGSLATDRTQVFNVSTGSSTNSISATSVGLYAPNGYANDYNGNYTAGGFGLQENTRGTSISLSAQEPSLQLVTTPAVAGYSATANYTAGGINTNYTFNINTGQLNIGSSVYINTGLLDLANNNITSVNNIQLNTINGFSPTTIGLTWSDFAGSNAYNYLPNNSYQLQAGGTISTQYVNSFQVDNNGVYVTTLDSQVLSIKDNNNFYAHYKINGLDTSDTAYEIQCAGGTQPLNIIASTINLNGSPLTPVVKGKFNYSGTYVSNGSSSAFYSSPATLPAGTFAVTWTFTFDANFLNNVSPTFYMLRCYAQLLSSAYGAIAGSGINPSVLMTYDSSYQTTLSYTDYYTINTGDTYYPYVYQDNQTASSGNVYLTGVFIQV